MTIMYRICLKKESWYRLLLKKDIELTKEFVVEYTYIQTHSQYIAAFISYHMFNFLNIQSPFQII